MRIVSKKSSLNSGLLNLDCKVASQIISDEYKRVAYNSERAIKVNNDKENVSNKEFFNALKQVADITEFTEEDCYTVLRLLYSDKYGVLFKNHTFIKTDMKAIIDGDFYDESRFYAVDLEILPSEDTIINSRHRYTMEELIELVKAKKIVIVREYFDPDSKDISERGENYYWFMRSCNACKDVKRAFSYDMFFSEKSEIFPYTLKYVSNVVSIARFRSLIINYVKNNRDCLSNLTAGSDIALEKEQNMLVRIYGQLTNR